MKKEKRIIIILVALLLVLSTSLCFSLYQNMVPEKISFDLKSWNECESLSALKEYLSVISDSKNTEFIPVKDRLAAFDLDGTLIGEQFPIYFEWMMYCHRVLNDKDYTPTQEQLDLAGDILAAAKAKTIPEGLELRENFGFGQVFSGMSTDEYKEYVKTFLNTQADGFENMKLSEAYFRPMIEIVELLKEYDFTIYIVSGTDRDADRVIAVDLLGLPNRQIIGTDYYSVASAQGELGYLDYQFEETDEVIREETSIIKNVKMSKVVQLAQELGQQPVLAFGNSSGDKSMFAFTTFNNQYKSAAFCLLPDDDVREYANDEKKKNLIAMCRENNWYTISMADDFKEIYGSNVKKSSADTSWLDDMLLIHESLRLEK